MKKLLLLMFAAAISFAAGAQNTNRLNGTVTFKKARTEQTIGKRNVKKNLALKAAEVRNSNVAMSRRAMSAGSLHSRKSSTVRKASTSLTVANYTKMYFISSNDWYHILTTDDGRIFYFDILTEDMESGRTYTTAKGDFDLDLCYLVYGEGDDDYSEATDIDFTWTKGANGKIDVVAHMTCVNGDQYTVTYAKAANPAPVGTVTKTFTDAVLSDYTNSQGIFMLAGADADLTATILFYGEQIAGTYDFNEIEGDYSLITISDGTEVGFIDADVTITAGEDSYTCHAVMMGDDKKVYDLTFVAPVKAAALDYDAGEDFIGDFGEGDIVSIDDYLDFGLAYLEAENEYGECCLLEFNIAEGDPDFIIPAGVYNIDYTYDDMTVSASEGIDENYYLTGSYFYTINEEGYVNVPAWFLVGGTVTVTYEDGAMKVVVDAVNSYGKSIRSTITYKPAAPINPGESLISNGGFEEWTSASQPAGWEGWQIGEKSNTGGAALSQSTDSYAGNYSCFVKGADKNKRLATRKITLPADTYVVQFYAKSDNGGVIKLGMATVQPNGDAYYDYGIAGEPRFDGISLTSDWKLYTYEFTIGQTTDASMLVMNYKNSGDFYIDEYTLFSKSQAVGIGTVGTPAAKGVRYNLAGQKVGHGYKGIVISGGKKMLVR